MVKTSVHFQPCKEISEIHNYRKKKLDYVRTQLTNKNENWMWDSSKSLADRREEIRKLVKEKTGRKMQSKAVPLHEAVVVVDEKTTMDDLKKLGKIYQQRFGIECIHISIHRDEGHWINRNGEDVGLKPTDNPTQEQITIEGVTWKPNLHAHMVFDWYNHDNGKSWKTSKQDARDMQTIAAEVLSMGRGQESTKQHLDGLSYKLAQKIEETEVQKIYIKNLQMKANILREQIGDNQEKLDEINRQKEEAERRRNAALKQAEELKEQLKLGSDWLKEQQVRTEEVKQSLAKELKQLENTKTAIKTNYSEIARQKQQMQDLKLYLAKANNRIETNSYAYDELEEFELDEMIGYLKEDIDDAKQEALNAKEILSERKKELEKANLRLSEGLDRLSSINTEVNKQKAVREQINAEIRELDTRIEERKEELRREPSEIVNAKQEGIAKGKKIAINEILNIAELQFKNNDAVTTEMIGKDWRKKFDQVQEAGNEKMQKAYSLFQYVNNAIDSIRTFVFKIRYTFSEEEKENIYKALDGKEENAPALRNLAYSFGGAICQYQYSSKWDQAERELRNIANGIREEEQQRNRGLRR